jgi:dihydrofolate synthase/folylpolyglutamate synthase
MQNYHQTLEWMFGRLPMYQRDGKVALEFKLDKTISWLNYLGNPQNKFKTIHVGGTNGKGSCSHMITSILMEEGYRVGLYTSPHLVDFRERIRTNEGMCSKEFVMTFIEAHKEYILMQQLSFFELTVGMAFSYFAEHNLDLAVIEVGMGGRLDSTNVITPILSIITTIGLDHQAFLGDTLEKIAHEKAGIIKHKIPVVIGQSQEETKAVFQNKAQQESAPIYWASDKPSALTSDLKGNYQVFNINTVVTAISVLNEYSDLAISSKAIQDGLLSVVSNTGIQGRWQWLRPNVVCDTAHNKDGLELVLKQLSQAEYNNLHLVFGMVKDKNPDDILALLPKNAYYYFVAPKINRALEASELFEHSKRFGLKGECCSSVAEGYQNALHNADNSDLIFIGGSTFVVAEVL